MNAENERGRPADSEETSTSADDGFEAGVYTFCHDGWLGILSLDERGAGHFEGDFLQLRDGRTHAVEAKSSAEDPAALTLVFHRFGQAREQIFRGRVLGPRRELVAGTTHWREIPFGFFARRSPFQLSPVYGKIGDVVDVRDVPGTYLLHHESGQGILEIWTTARRLKAEYRSDTGDRKPAQVNFGGEFDHKLQLAFELDKRSFEATGYFFTHTKNGAAGLAKWEDRDSAFSMHRFGPNDR